MLSQEKKIVYLRVYINMMKGVSPNIIAPRNKHEKQMLENLYHRARYKVKEMGREIKV